MDRSDVTAAGSHQSVVINLLDAVSGPPRHACHGEDRRVKLDRKSHVVIEPRTCPVHIRRQLLLLDDRSLNWLRHSLPTVIVVLAGKLLAVTLENQSTWISMLVDSVAKP